MICKNCGCEIGENDAVCPHCDEPVDQRSTGYSQQVDEEFLYENKRNRNLGIKIVLLIVSVAVALYLARLAIAFVVVKNVFNIATDVATKVETQEFNITTAQDLPLTVYDSSSYDYTATLEIESVDYESEFLSSYVTLKVKVKLVDQPKSSYDSDYYTIKYKVKDEEGTVVDNKQIMLEIVDEGDTVEEESTVFNLDSDENYTLEFVVNNK